MPRRLPNVVHVLVTSSLLSWKPYSLIDTTDGFSVDVQFYMRMRISCSQMFPVPFLLNRHLLQLHCSSLC